MSEHLRPPLPINPNETAKFLSEFVIYIKTHRRIDYSDSGENHSPRDSFACHTRESGHCPDQQFTNPECHKCPQLELIRQAAQKAANENNFSLAGPTKYSDIGAVWFQFIYDSDPQNRVNLNIDGNMQGQVSLDSTPTRLPK